MLRENTVNSQQKGIHILEFWEAALSYRALQQNSTSISQEKITGENKWKSRKLKSTWNILK